MTSKIGIVDFSVYLWYNLHTYRFALSVKAKLRVSHNVITLFKKEISAMAKKNMVQFSKEERTRIMRLPMTKAQSGGGITSGYFDPDSGMFYKANEAGIPTGEVAKAPQKYIDDWNQKNAAKVASMVPTTPPSDKAAAKIDGEDEDDSITKKKKKGMAFIAVLLVVALAFSAFIIAGPVLGVLPTSSSTPISGETLVVNSDSDEPENVVYVIQAAEDILKGDVIKEEMLKRVAVSVSDYNRIIASGGAPCKWDEVATVIGMYAGNYLKAEQYVNDTDIQIEDPVIDNPWAEYSKEDFSIVTLPIDAVQSDGTIFVGALCDLEITREVTSIEEAKEAEEEKSDSETEEEVEVTVEEIPAEDIDGLTMEEGLSQSYTVNVYHVENGVVCDVLNEDGDSIYPYYAQYIELPPVKQVAMINELRTTDEDFVDDVEAHYVVVLITAGQEDIIGDISGDKVVMTLTGEVDNDTTEKQIVSSGFKTISDILATELVEEE